MIKVKTFSSPLKIFHARNEMNELDQMVNDFLARTRIKHLVSVSDTHTTDDTGATSGLIRVVAYEE